MKNKKTMWVFIFQKYGKFWSVSLEYFIKHKPLISEEWCKYIFSIQNLIRNVSILHPQKYLVEFCCVHHQLQCYEFGLFSLLKLHSSEIRGLCLMKWPSERLQNLPYFWNTKTHVVFSFFISCYFIFPPNECPGLCWHRPGHSLGEKIK